MPSPPRPPRLLAYGFAFSVMLHAVVLPFVRATPTVAEEPLPPEILITARPKATPRPPVPTPTPRPLRHVLPPRVRAATGPHHLRIVTFHAVAQPRGGPAEAPAVDATGVPDGAPYDGATGAPLPAAIPAFTPTAVPRPTPMACSRPDVAAATLRAVEPELPALAQQQGIHGEVDIVVSLDAASRVVDATVQSSPSRLLDASALAAARASQFRTEVHDCTSIPARYLFRVDFTAE